MSLPLVVAAAATRVQPSENMHDAGEILRHERSDCAVTSAV
jgi:hypothetical protein